MRSLPFLKPLDMGKGRVSSTLFMLAVPTMISLFFQNLYSLVDIMFVSWVGTTPLAALSLSVPVFYLALALVRGIGLGTTTLMSSARGEGDEKKADSLAEASLPLMLLILCPLLILTLPGPCKYIFSLLGAKGEVLLTVHDYALWLSLSFPVMGYAMLCESILMSHGDSVTPMKGMVLGNILNLILDPVLIFSANMGVEGASLASLIGWIFTAYYLRRKLITYGYSVPVVKKTGDMIKQWRRIWGIGYVITLSMIVVTFSVGAMNWFLAREGAAAIGAWNLMSRVELMIVLPFMGISHSLVPFVGFNFGRRNKERIIAAVKTSLCIELSGMAVFSLLFIYFSKEIIGLFNPGQDVLQWGAYALRASATAYIFFPFELTLMGTAQGLRRPVFSLVTSIFRQIFLRIPLAALLYGMSGVKGIYWSHPLSMVAGGLLSAALIMVLLRNENILDRSRMSQHHTGANDE
ncbi:MAG: MATE family efflux transporter [Desulfatiglans sp.]|nr:MATE family efflux transporter [Desulfatiglans sp.]